MILVTFNIVGVGLMLLAVLTTILAMVEDRLNWSLFGKALLVAFVGGVVLGLARGNF